MKPKLLRRMTLAALGAGVAALVVSVPAGGAGAPTATTTTTTTPATSTTVAPTTTSAPAATAPAAGPAVRRAAIAPAATCPPGAICSKLRVEGSSRMAKVGADVPLVPGEFDARAFIIINPPDPNWPLRIEGDLTLPTVRQAYLVVLRFMPSTNDIDFIQDGKATGRGRIVQPPDQPQGLYVETDVVAKLFVRLSNVKQDGIDLKVGNNCRTEVSAEIPIHAVIKLEVGATATTQATFGMPRFRGCGTTENLDPLFSGLVSGPGNDLRSKLTVLSVGAT